MCGCACLCMYMSVHVCMYMYMCGEKINYFIFNLITCRHVVASLQIKCGYARTAIRELSASKKGISGNYIDIQKQESEFKSWFALPTFCLTDDMFTCNKSSRSHFDYLCECTLNAFAKKWHPTNKRLKYIDTFSISKLNNLPNTLKEYQSLTNCNIHYSSHLSL